MRDAVDLIGKPIIVKEKKYIISTINFLPTPAQPDSYIWFGLAVNGSVLNYPYEDLLPYLKEQIKL
jgi:hypothetical protein